MSATSSSTDPVQTVIDLLSGTTAANWPAGTKPSHIERLWESNEGTKLQREQPAAYVYSSDLGTREALSTAWDVADQGETVSIEVWDRDDDAVGTIAEDVLAILEDYVNDKQQQTEWDRIRPDPAPLDDQRSEALAGRRAEQYIVEVRVRLRREDTIGT